MVAADDDWADDMTERVLKLEGRVGTVERDQGESKANQKAQDDSARNTRLAIVGVVVTVALAVAGGWLTLRDQVSRLETRSDAMEKNFDRIDQKLDRMESKIESLVERLPPKGTP